MIDLNADMVRDMLAEYLNNDELDGKRDQKIYGDLSYLAEKMEEIEIWSFPNGEVEKVLNSLKICADGEMERENQKAVRGIKNADVAFIAAHYGFMFGLVWSENLRLKFYEGWQND